MNNNRSMDDTQIEVDTSNPATYENAQNLDNALNTASNLTQNRVTRSDHLDLGRTFQVHSIWRGSEDPDAIKDKVYAGLKSAVISGKVERVKYWLSFKNRNENVQFDFNEIEDCKYHPLTNPFHGMSEAYYQGNLLHAVLFKIDGWRTWFHLTDRYLEIFKLLITHGVNVNHSATRKIWDHYNHDHIMWETNTTPLKLAKTINARTEILTLLRLRQAEVLLENAEDEQTGEQKFIAYWRKYNSSCDLFMLHTYLEKIKMEQKGLYHSFEKEQVLRLYNALTKNVNAPKRAITF